jgi:hypothetical protein
MSPTILHEHMDKLYVMYFCFMYLSCNFKVPKNEVTHMVQSQVYHVIMAKLLINYNTVSYNMEYIIFYIRC